MFPRADFWDVRKQVGEGGTGERRLRRLSQDLALPPMQRTMEVSICDSRRVSRQPHRRKEEEGVPLSTSTRLSRAEQIVGGWCSSSGFSPGNGMGRMAIARCAGTGIGNAQRIRRCRRPAKSLRIGVQAHADARAGESFGGQNAAGSLSSIPYTRSLDAIAWLAASGPPDGAGWAYVSHARHSLRALHRTVDSQPPDAIRDHGSAILRLSR